MRILITNDDGIDAPGLSVLQEIASELAGEGGSVLTVAPAEEQSGTGHSVSFINPLMFSRRGPDSIAVSGTPADCVLVGLHEFEGDDPPDLVLAGVNRGNNSGENAVYSGTIGAVLEASLQGVRAIALSQYFGPSNRRLADPFEPARRHGRDVVASLLADAPWGDAPYGLFYNVNFPPCGASDVAGTKAATQGARLGTKFSVSPLVSPSGRNYMWIRTGRQDAPANRGSDVEANLGNFISITPMRADLTDHSALEAIAPLFP
ncbi:MAG: 5'/3'-nucleotidase SurE [Rhodobacteraceae bacterium]|nr:5'/3'-nucleotidase SurE [Paracoccaceae bacterium]